MKIAIIGYGKMGKAIEEIAKSRGHRVSEIIDIALPGSFDSDGFRQADVAIEFTTPRTAVDNFKKCFERGKAVVSGTTGWLDKMGEVRALCDAGGATLFYSSNYSLGVNIFFELNRQLARLMNRFDAYAPSMSETHHVHKLDAPSGTAINLAEDVVAAIDRLDGWMPDKTIFAAGDRPDEVVNATIPAGRMPITSVREGEVPGVHAVRYESDDDLVEIRHSAKSRRGLALGAVLAAEFTAGKSGFLTMKDMLGF